mmetsp:Transcript_26719/g.85035  ORF Transcript_26719/g.85035 Transcript_26719/m.85035 type:complete len:232 (-) Transcript_26719:1281-1976(-)
MRIRIRATYYGRIRAYAVCGSVARPARRFGRARGARATSACEPRELPGAPRLSLRGARPRRGASLFCRVRAIEIIQGSSALLFCASTGGRRRQGRRERRGARSESGRGRAARTARSSSHASAATLHLGLARRAGAWPRVAAAVAGCARAAKEAAAATARAGGRGRPEQATGRRALLRRARPEQAAAATAAPRCGAGGRPEQATATARGASGGGGAACGPKQAASSATAGAG